MRERHIVDGRTYHHGTERYVVYALCGYEEEAAGSGRHGLLDGERPCQACLRINRAQLADEPSAEIACIIKMIDWTEVCT